MSVMAAAGSVVVGVGIDTMDEEEDEEDAAEAMVRSDVAAVRAEMNLMENMVAEWMRVAGVTGRESSRIGWKSRLSGVSAKRSLSSSSRAVVWAGCLARLLRQQT
jgi:hypothetical protein